MTVDLQWFISAQLDAKRRVDRDWLARQKLDKCDRGAIEAALIILDKLAHRRVVKAGDEHLTIEWTGEFDSADFTRVYRTGDADRVDLWDTDDAAFDKAANEAFIELAHGGDVFDLGCKYEGRWTRNNEWDYGNVGDRDD